MRSVTVVVMFAIVLFLGACSDKGGGEIRPMKIGTNVWPGYEPLYLAKERSYFDKGAVKLVEYTSASDVIRAFRNGVINAAALTLDEALLLKAQGFGNTVVLVLDISDGGDVIMASEPIGTMAELRGKKIGVEETALGAYVLSRALELAGLSLQDVTAVALEASEHEKAMISGGVDAVVTFEPVRTKLLERGSNEIFTSKQIPGEVVDVLVVEDAFLQANKQAVIRMITAWSKAIDYMEASPLEAAQIMGKRQGISAEQFLASLEGLYLPDLEENRGFFKGSEPSIYRISMKLAEVLSAKGLIDSSQLQTRQMFAPGWLQK